MTNIASTDDRRVDNNPPQRSIVPGDPMRVQYRVLSDADKASMGAIKLAFEDLWKQVDLLGSSRETSLAKTHLEDACMWAIKHLTRPAT